MRVTVTAADLAPDRPARSWGSGVPTIVTPSAPGGAGRPYRLLAGSVPGAETVAAWCVTEPAAVAALESLAASGGTLDRRTKMRLAGDLAPPLRAPQVAALLEHRDPAEVWRWAELHRAHACLRDAVLEGKLQATHARPLLTMPHEAQAEWTARALRGRWSVRQLAAAIRQDHGAQPEAPSSADIQALETKMGDRLGAKVRLAWPEDPAAPRRLAIEWFDIESLKGILAQLAAGPDLEERPQVQARQLVIQVQNASELSALTQHLLGE